MRAMSQIPTPPPSRGVSVSPNDDCRSTATSDDKVQLLDELLERYLHLLDRHQKLQELLGKQLSSGFFQLTHANYCSPGRRFGEDFYDERMKATRRLEITASSSDNESNHNGIDTRLEKVQFAVNYKSVLDPEDDKEEGKEEEDEYEKDSKQHSDVSNDTEEDNKQKPDISTTPTPPQTTQDNEDVDSTRDDNDDNNKKKPSRKLFRSDDPISWYGILVPPSLRNAQKSFTEAVNDGIPELVTVVREMQYVETLVYELRQQIKMAA